MEGKSFVKVSFTAKRGDMLTTFPAPKGKVVLATDFRIQIPDFYCVIPVCCQFASLYA
jgi:hypothetical protein